MAKLDNTITVTLSAYDMLNVLGATEIIFSITGFPTEQLKKSFENFHSQVMENTSVEAMDEAVAELHVEMLMNNINKN